MVAKTKEKETSNVVKFETMAEVAVEVGVEDGVMDNGVEWDEVEEDEDVEEVVGDLGETNTIKKSSDEARGKKVSLLDNKIQF